MTKTELIDTLKQQGFTPKEIAELLAIWKTQKKVTNPSNSEI